MKRTGVILVFVGLLITIFTGLTFVTREKAIDFGNFSITSKRQHRLAWSPIFGVAIMAVGAGIYITKRKIN